MVDPLEAMATMAVLEHLDPLVHLDLPPVMVILVVLERLVTLVHLGMMLSTFVFFQMCLCYQ
jgi:hypothetical protein